MEWIDIFWVDVYDTENPVPREEGNRPRHRTAAFKNIGVGLGGLGLGYAGVKIGKAAPKVASAAEAWEKSAPSSIAHRVLSKAKRMFRLNSKSKLVHFAAGDYARKYLPGDPLLAKKGEPEYNPRVEAQVKAALARKRPRTEKQQKAYAREVGRTAELKPGYAPKDVIAGGEEGKRRFMPLLKIQRKYREIRKQMRQQGKGLRTPPKEPEPMPGEMLPKERGKVPVRGHDYEGGRVSELWDYGEAGKPAKIVYIAPARQHPHKKTPLTAKQVSAKAASEYRDPLAWHRARVEAGVTPNLIETRYTHKKNLPDVFLPHASAVAAGREAQAVRDELANKLRSLRKDIIQPLRAKRRQAMGLPPAKPMTALQKHQLWKSSEKMGYAPLKGEIEKPGMKTMVPVGGTGFHPTVLAKAHEKLQSEIAGSSAIHKQKAQAIHEHIQQRLREGYGRIDLERHHPGMADIIKRGMEQSVNKAFNPERRTLPLEEKEAKELSEHLAAPVDWVKKQHKDFLHHNYWSSEAGEKRIKQVLQLQLFKRTPGEVAGTAAKAGFPALKRAGLVGAGVAGAAGLGAYLYKRRKNKEKQFSIGDIAQKLKGFRLTKIGKKEAILGGALAGGITAADAATSAVNPDPDKTRAQSAWAGAKRGALYGGVLAGTELPLRRALLRQAPPLFQFKEKENTTAHDIAVGGIEGAGGFYTTDKLIKAIKPQTTGGKLLTAGIVGGAATGTIGYGLNRFLRSFRRNHREKQMRSKLKETRFAYSLPSTEGASAPYNPKRKLTVAQDRYRKMVRQNEIQRKEANLAKSAVAGAALGGALRGKVGAGIGAAAGTAASAALTLRNRRTRDPFGEESIAAKRVERIPYQAAGLGLAGIAAGKLWKRARKVKLSNPSKLVRFQQTIPIEPEPKPWSERQAQRWLRHPVGRVTESYKWINRVKKLHRDIKAPKDRSGMIIDERGRTREPEWRKDWFKKSLVTGGAVGILGGAALLGRRIGKVSEVATRAMGHGLPESALTETERAALYAKTGNIGRAIKSAIPRPSGFFGGLRGKFGGIRSELKQMREGTLGKANRWVEGKVGGIEHAEPKIYKEGTPEERVTGIKVSNPAYTAERLKGIHGEEEKAKKRYEGFVRERQRLTKKAGAGQQSIEDIIKKKELRSKLKLIQFQNGYEGYVQVKPHYRKQRREKRPLEKKSNREALLIGAGTAGVGSALGLGFRLASTREERARKYEAKLEKLALQRVKKWGGKLLSSKLDDIIQFKTVTKTYLIRHGCTSYNGSEDCPDVIRGHIDVPLNERGRQQAAKLGQKLKGKNIDHIYTSDLSRAHETAEIVSDHLGGVPITPTEGLRPWKLGSEIEGKESSKVNPKINHYVDTPDREPKDGESFNTFKDRFLNSLHEIRGKHPEGSIAIVTHYRGLKLLKAHKQDGEFSPSKFKAKKDEIQPAGYEVISH